MVRRMATVGAVVLVAAWRGGASASPRAAASSCTAQEVGGRSGHAMAYDARARRVMMFGGESGDPRDAWPRSLWSWDGRRWTCVAPEGPPGRRDGELAYDAARRRLVLYGGRVVGPGRQVRQLTDTWEWDGDRWRLADSVGPPARTHMAVAYDPARRAVLLHGGVGESNWEQGGFTDTWTWDGKAWRQLALGPRPPGITNALLGTPRGVALMLALADSAPECGGLQRAALLELRDRATAWSRVGTKTPGPCFSPQGAAAWTPDGVLLYAGWEPDAAPAASWRLRGGAWERTDSAPPRRRSARIAYDPARRRAVLFGGDDDASVRGDTWEWDGRRWARAVEKR